MTEDYQPAFDSFGSWLLATMALREAGVRSGAYQPVSADERRQAGEGPRDWSALDCLRRSS